MSEKKNSHPVYSNNVIDFVTVSAAVCSFLEKNDEVTTKEFVDRLTKLLPMLYLKTALLPVLMEETDGDLQSAVTEEDYEAIRQMASDRLGSSDGYLEVFTEGMQYSDTPVLVTISENLADIYQDLKDMLVNFQSAELSIMNDAVLACKTSFEEYWGQKLLNALRALHNLCYSQTGIFDDEEEDFKI